jgi:hypothetical protein
VLVTLLVLWVVVVPVLTVAGTYVASGVLGRRVRTRNEQVHGLAAQPAPIAASGRHRRPSRTRGHAGSSPDGALIER